MRMRQALLAICLPAIGLAGLVPTSVSALQPALPDSSVRVRVESEEYGSQRLPITDWEPGGPQTIWAEGKVTQEVWQVRRGRRTTLQLLAPLRRQLEDDGYEIIFECRDRGCGGFDFRYALDLAPEPDMHVDLSDYRYLTAQRMNEQRPDYVSVMVSRGAGRGFVQLTRIGSGAQDSVLSAERAVSDREKPAAVLSTSSRSYNSGTVDTLTRSGRAVLEDLEFATGSSRLTGSRFESLAKLAAYLSDNPDARIVLVGHTDDEGSMDGNLSLSRARATSVMQRLSQEYGVAQRRMQAQGVGFLAPIASNETEEGRNRNRRVEVILKTPG